MYIVDCTMSVLHSAVGVGGSHLEPVSQEGKQKGRIVDNCTQHLLFPSLPSPAPLLLFPPPLQVTKKKDLSDLYRNLYRSRDVQEKNQQQQQQRGEGGGDAGKGRDESKGKKEGTNTSAAEGSGKDEDGGKREDELVRVAREAAAGRRMQSAREGGMESAREGGRGSAEGTEDGGRRGEGLDDARSGKGAGADDRFTSVHEQNAKRDGPFRRREAEGADGELKGTPLGHAGDSNRHEAGGEPRSRSDRTLPPPSSSSSSLPSSASGGQKRGAEDRVKSARERFLARKQQRTEPPPA